MKGTLRKSIPILSLAVVVTLVWCLNYNRLTWSHWDVPVEYSRDRHWGDSNLVLAWIKAAAELNCIPFRGTTVDRLGAPYHANWNDFPMPDKILIFVVGMLARWVGLFKAANLAVLLSFVASAISFYCCCRLLRFKREWAWVGAILFAFTYYNFFRGLGHLVLLFTYTIPLAVVSSWIIAASKRLKWGDKFCWLCLLVSVVMGLSNPYYLNIYVQLLIIGLLIQLFSLRRKENLLMGAVSLGLAGLAFVAVNLDTLSYQMAHGWNPNSMERYYYESELYGLKLIELVIPPAGHRMGWLDAIGRSYAVKAVPGGELFAPYLGIIAMGGLLWIFGDAARRMLERTRRRFPLYSIQSLWIFFYSTVGGVNGLIALAGVTVFRATNRYSIFLSAISLLFIVSRLSVLSRSWRPWLRLSLASVIVLVGLYDQLPRSVSNNDIQATIRMIEADRKFAAKMESALPSGAMVFQLPVMVFPEALPQNQLMGYELLRPHFFSKTLRFSFGDNKGRPRDNWQWEVEKMPPQQMAAALEKYGFSAIYLNRRGFPNRAEELLKGLAAAGKTKIMEDDLGEQVCILLSPSPQPKLPDSADEAVVVFCRGWAIIKRNPLENRQWSNGNASLSFFNPQKESARYRFKGVVGTLSPRRVSILFEGKELWSAKFNPQQIEYVDLVLPAKPGNNVIEFRTDSKAVPSPENEMVSLAFALMDVKIKRTGSPGQQP